MFLQWQIHVCQTRAMDTDSVPLTSTAFYATAFQNTMVLRVNMVRQQKYHNIAILALKKKVLKYLVDTNLLLYPDTCPSGTSETVCLKGIDYSLY